jgi:hypothetical protein
VGGLRQQEAAKQRATHMDRHKRVLGLKRPEGVSIMMDGGFSGYSGGNLSLPW